MNSVNFLIFSMTIYFVLKDLFAFVPLRKKTFDLMSGKIFVGYTNSLFGSPFVGRTMFTDWSVDRIFLSVFQN